MTRFDDFMESINELVVDLENTEDRDARLELLEDLMKEARRTKEFA